MIERGAFLKNAWLLALLAAALTVMVYLPSVKGEFLDFDDPEYVVDNPYIRTPDADFVVWSFSTFRGSGWHPLTWLTYGMDYALWGLDPFGFRLTNTILHGLNVVLVMLFLIRAFRIRGELSGGAVLFGASVAGLVFGLHPLHVESVAWVSERRDVLYSLFCLLSLYSYLIFASTGRARAYTVCLALYALSLMSKPMAVTLPAVLLVLDYYPLKRLNSLKVAVLEKIPFFVLSAFASYMTIAAHVGRDTMGAIDVHSVWIKSWIAVKALFMYLYKTLLPAGLSPFYPLPRVVDWRTLEYLGPLVVVALITILCLVFLRRRPVFLAAWMFFLITLLPVLGFLQVNEVAMADRYMYLPILAPISLAALAGAAAWHSFSAGRKYLVVAAAITVVVLSALTLMQTRVWMNPDNFWSYVLKKNPHDPATNYFAGKKYYNDGDYGRAISSFDISIAGQPFFPSAFYYRGLSKCKSGRCEDALEDFSGAVRLAGVIPETRNPNVVPYFNFYMGRGKAYEDLGRYGEALEDYTAAIRMSPGTLNPYLDRAGLYALIGDDFSAVGDFEKAISLDTGNPLPYNRLALFYKERKDYDMAIVTLGEAISRRPGEGILYVNRGNAYFEKGDAEKAVSDYRKAARLGVKEAADYLESMGMQ
jgi:tetratricopeptide (TPR) repeat protein